MNARRVVDLAGFDVPVIDPFIDRLHGQCIALLAVAQGLFRLPAAADVADGADQPNCPSRRVADRQSMILDPAIGLVSGPDAVLALYLQRALLEAVSHRRAVGFHVFRMNALIPILRREPTSLEAENLHQTIGDKK